MLVYTCVSDCRENPFACLLQKIAAKARLRCLFAEARPETKTHKQIMKYTEYLIITTHLFRKTSSSLILPTTRYLDFDKTEDSLITSFTT